MAGVRGRSCWVYSLALNYSAVVLGQQVLEEMMKKACNRNYLTFSALSAKLMTSLGHVNLATTHILPPQGRLMTPYYYKILGNLNQPTSLQTNAKHVSLSHPTTNVTLWHSSNSMVLNTWGQSSPLTSATQPRYTWHHRCKWKDFSMHFSQGEPNRSDHKPMSVTSSAEPVPL